jgi:hypothetical protein
MTTSTRCPAPTVPAGQPPFNPIVYAIEVVLPVVKSFALILAAAIGSRFKR